MSTPVKARKEGSNPLNTLQSSLGDESPLLNGSGRRAPDRRRVSIRWMFGSVLTGLTSLLLMGGALYAALDGRQQLAQPANILAKLTAQSDDSSNSQQIKGDRPVTIVALQPVREKVMQVPTVTRVGDSNVIKKRPFALASAPLAVAPQRNINYPNFNPLTVFRASGVDNTAGSSDVIYGADIESEVRIQQVPFQLDDAQYDDSTQISAREAEIIVRNARSLLSDGQTQIAALPYLDTSRFALKEEEVPLTTGLDIRIVAENVSSMEPVDDEISNTRNFVEDVIVVPSEQRLEGALASLQLQSLSLQGMIAAMESELGTGPLPDGTKLRVAWEQLEGLTQNGKPRRVARRISVYRAGQHIKSVVLNDEDKVVWATTPTPIPAIAAEDERDEEAIATVARSNMPTVYDGLYRAALSQGLDVNQARRIVRTVAFDVDFRKRISPDDNLEVFFSIEEGREEATENSEILYIGLTLSGVRRTYYRYRAGDDGSVDYYDENGKSAKKFLLRKPVPNGRFRSPFGPRRHPISRVVKMHQGVDFSAPRGTAIIAAGNGVVEQAKWSGGYGRQTIIRHTNGYKTSYSHQHRFAKGIKVGARVRQGQIIGQVGSTGYSTGPHLHYEVIVNGRRVNPMKIRLPRGRVLKDNTLAAFKRERDRINALLERGRGPEQTVAALQ